MFRRSMILAVVALGCGSGSGGGGGGGGGGSGATDMATALGDLAAGAAADLAGVAPAGCNTLAICIDGCSNDACVMLCQSRATAHAVSLHDAAQQCAENWCVLGPNDMGVGRCVYDAMMNPVDPPGAAMGTCDTCLADALAMLRVDKTCATPGGRDCNPASCVPAQMACLADKP